MLVTKQDNRLVQNLPEQSNALHNMPRCILGPAKGVQTKHCLLGLLRLRCSPVWKVPWLARWRMAMLLGISALIALLKLFLLLH